MITAKELTEALEKWKRGLLCRVKETEEHIENVDKWMGLIKANIQAGKEVLGSDCEFKVKIKWWIANGDGPYVVISMPFAGTAEEAIRLRGLHFDRLDELVKGDFSGDGCEVIFDIEFV